MGKLFTLLVLALIASGVAYYFGYFDTPQFKIENIPSYNLYYTTNVGPYSQVGPVFNGLEKEFGTLDVNTSNLKDSLGIYLDNPEIVSKDKLRSIIGYIFENENPKGKLPDNTYITKTQSLNSVLTVEFPYKNYISIIVGTMKIYPAIKEYSIKNNIATGLAIMEIYKKDTIKYIVIDDKNFLNEYYGKFH